MGKVLTEVEEIAKIKERSARRADMKGAREELQDARDAVSEWDHRLRHAEDVRSQADELLDGLSLARAADLPAARKAIAEVHDLLDEIESTVA